MNSNDTNANVDMFENLGTQSEVEVPSPPKGANAAFVHKCLHPPSAIPGFVGLPTMDTRTQTVLNYTIPQLMSPPTLTKGMFENIKLLDLAEQTAMRIGILTLTGAKVLSIAFCYDTVAGKWYQDIANTINNDAYDFTHFEYDATLYRPCYKSMTTHLNATMFNNTGMVTGNQFNPNMLFQGVPSTFLLQDYKAGSAFLRHLLKSDVVRVLDADDFMIEEHHNLFEQLPRFIVTELMQDFKLKPKQIMSIPPNYSVQILMMNPFTGANPWNGSFPFPTASQITQQSARSWTGKAMEGTFTVSRLNTVSPKWCPASNVTAGGASDGHLPFCYFAYLNAGEFVYGSFWEHSTNTSGAPEIMSDTYWTTDITCSWTLYDGLSFNSTSNALQTTSQLLIYKHCFGMEVQPSLKSAWAGTVVLAPKPDMMAMQRLLDAFYEIKDCLPARYNFWGMLGKMAMDWLPKIGGGLLSHVFKVNNESDGKLFNDAAALVKPFKKMIVDEKASQVARTERHVGKVTKQAVKYSHSDIKKQTPKKNANMDKKYFKATGERDKMRKLYGKKKKVVAKTK